MNTAEVRFWVGFAVLGVAIAAGFTKMHSDATLLEASRRECAEIQAKAEARDQAISDLRAKLANQPNRETVAHSVAFPSSPDALGELAHRVEQLAVQQTNILALLQRLASKEGALESAERRLQGQEKVW